MKKQLFILLIAIFAIGMSNAYGQVTCPVPRPIVVTCLSADALHPIPGSPYDYTVLVPTPPGTKEYTWFVTQDKSFITAGALTLTREIAGGAFLAATGTGYNDPLTGTATLSLTWKSFVYDATNPVFVVIQAKSTGGVCTPNNLKVYKIQPVNAFTLDIANIGADKTTVAAYETPIDRCISDVVSAVYDVPTDKVVMDFGVDYLYFVVTAANFSTSWLPSFKIIAIDANEAVTAVEWFRPTDATFTTPTAMTLAAGIYTSASPVAVLDLSGAVGPAGECIVIRVTIDHTVPGVSLYEGITPETVTVAVDGKTQLALATPLGDIHFSKTVGIAADCGIEDGFNNDIATQVILPRPDIQPVTPTPFIGIRP